MDIQTRFMNFLEVNSEGNKVDDIGVALAAFEADRTISVSNKAIMFVWFKDQSAIAIRQTEEPSPIGLAGFSVEDIRKMVSALVDNGWIDNKKLTELYIEHSGDSAGKATELLAAAILEYLSDDRNRWENIH